MENSEEKYANAADEPVRDEPGGENKNSLKTFIHTMIWFAVLTLLWVGGFKVMELATGR